MFFGRGPRGTFAAESLSHRIGAIGGALHTHGGGGGSGGGGLGGGVGSGLGAGLVGKGGGWGHGTADGSDGAHGSGGGPPMALVDRLATAHSPYHALVLDLARSLWPHAAGPARPVAPPRPNAAPDGGGRGHGLSGLEADVGFAGGGRSGGELFARLVTELWLQPSIAKGSALSLSARARDPSLSILFTLTVSVSFR
jgi:hypothetical protein